MRPKITVAQGSPLLSALVLSALLAASPLDAQTEDHVHQRSEDHSARSANDCSTARSAFDPSPADDFTRLVEVDPNDRTNLASRVPLILIHGLGGNKLDSADDDVCQPNLDYWANLTNFLRASTTASATYKLYSFHYVTNEFSVWEIARALRNDLDQKIGEDQERHFDKRFILIAHSMGGVIARNYMNYHSHNVGQWINQRGGERVEKLITLGTPHHGSPVANDRSRDELTNPFWRDFFQKVSYFFWTDDALRPWTYVSADEPNRSDLLWDNFDAVFDNRNPDINRTLATLNAEEKYGSRIVVYSGYLLRDDPARQTLAEGLHLTEAAPGAVAITLEILREYKAAKDDRMVLLLSSIAMDLGLRSVFRENDGVVPRSSGAAQGVGASKRVECPAYDHNQLKDGAPFRCGNNLTIFRSLAADLNIVTPPVGIISSAGFVNSASYRLGPAAPGEVITLFGSNLGARGLRTMQVGVNGRAMTWLGGTSVLFDGVAAPLLYVSESQISAIVPYSVAGRTSVQIAVDYQGVRSNTITVPVVAASPGIFTVDASGRGQAAALNEDGTLNSSTRPIEAGKVVVLFGTGEGQTTPTGQDGLLARSVYPKPRLPVAVSIGGLPAEVLYAGAAPNLVAGALQVNARIPSGVASGNVSVILTIGEFSSQSGVTVAVRNTSSTLPDASPVTGFWDVSEYQPGGRDLRRGWFRQDGTTLSGELDGIYHDYTSRTGTSDLTGVNDRGQIIYRFRARTPDSEVANVTVETTGTLSPNGDSLSGAKVAYYDAGSSATGTFNATRRRLRGSSLSFEGVIRSQERTHFAIWVPRGARVTAEVVADRLGSNLDAVLDMLESDGGTVIASDDDTYGRDPSLSLLASQSPSSSQLVYLRVRGYDATTDGTFRLDVSIQTTQSQILPVQAPVAPFPATANGVITARDEVDIYAVDLSAGVSVEAEVLAERVGSLLDSVLTVLGPDGVTELAVSDDGSGIGSDSRVAFTTRFAGRHFFAVQSYGSGGFGPNYTYTLDVRRSTAAGYLSADPQTLYTPTDASIPVF